MSKILEDLIKLKNEIHNLDDLRKITLEKDLLFTEYELRELYEFIKKQED